mmetsp:Transcript_31641/g.49459  ORF Transcript_31641/g.49459 Transcript_31641/m.49459 type:complete len:264 (+) Transcript_31641:1274-2065(+)
MSYEKSALLKGEGAEFGQTRGSMEMTEEWRTGHFGCLSDNCSAFALFMGCFCFPCSIASAVTDSVQNPDGCDYCCLCCGVCSSYAFFSPGSYTHFRKSYRIKGTECLGSPLCCDWCYTACCPCCMSCQIQNQAMDKNIPPPPPNRNPTMQPWTQSFCDFTTNIPGCLYACFCPFCAWGSLSAMYAGTPCIYECCCGNIILLRYNMRHLWNIEPPTCGCFGDFCLLLCCPCCGYVQMKAEVEAKGPMFPEEDDCCPRCCADPLC